VAIYSLRVQTIDRASGRSVIAAAAYRAGVSLADRGLGVTFDFSKKNDGIAHTAIIAPENAPAEFRDREALWNAAEEADKRKDSVPAREVLVALPHELTDLQRRELVEEFARESFVKHGMVADIAIHRPGEEGDNRNHHAHILLTTRNVGPDGFAAKNPDWTKREFVVDVRREWAEVQNKYLERHAPGVAKVSEKTLAERGIDREPTQHKGPDVTAMERRGLRTARGEDNRDIRAENAGREREDRTLNKRVMDDFSEMKWTRRPTDGLIKEMVDTRAVVAAQRDAWKQRHDTLAVEKPPSIKKIENGLTAKEAAAHKRALAQEEAAKAQARSGGISVKQLAQWYKNPGKALTRSLVAWNAELDRIAAARRETQRTERELEAKRAWLKSDKGRAHIDNIRQPGVDAAKAAKTEKRTLDRKIKRLDKQIGLADEAILTTKAAKRLGHETLQAPANIPTAKGRPDANTKRYFRFMSASAKRVELRTPEVEFRSALRFVRGLAPGAPIPSAKPPLQPGASGPAPKGSPDLPDL
jgi:ATP-dependent exoDNAse (exonuclease V) alpha subunit